MAQQIWILEWRYASENEVNVTCWDSELDALSEACNEILLFINDAYDLTDQSILENAHEINNLVSAKKYQEAIDYFHDNDCSADPQIWSVYPKYVLDNATPPTALTLPPLNTITPPTANVVDEPFVPTASGATCRGPCGQHNEYAMADNSDGTFVCRSCKMMRQVFGNSTP